LELETEAVNEFDPMSKGRMEKEKRKENKRPLFECRGMSPRMENEKKKAQNRKVR